MELTSPERTSARLIGPHDRWRVTVRVRGSMMMPSRYNTIASAAARTPGPIRKKTASTAGGPSNFPCAAMGIAMIENPTNPTPIKPVQQAMNQTTNPGPRTCG